jgi:nucleotide-binding universal stress UspA family protein
MAFPYKVILCPISFDENSYAAVDKAAELATHFKARVYMVHIIPLARSLGEGSLPWGVEAEERKAVAKLKELEKQKLNNLEYQSLVYTGDILTGILDAQQKYDADLIVMATHGRSGVQRLILGSIAAGIIRKAPCPVMTIQPHN